MRPVSSVRRLLYDEWVENTRKQVDKLSKGKLGYLHIRGMNMSSFRKMEEDLFAAGHGKQGLIIDVRFNGGGSINPAEKLQGFDQRPLVSGLRV